MRYFLQEHSNMDRGSRTLRENPINFTLCIFIMRRNSPFTIGAATTLLASVAMVSAFGTLAALATPSPTANPGQAPGGGQPGAPGTTCGSPGATVTPGQSGSSTTGSPFNPTGNAGTHYAGNPNTPSLQHSNSPTSVSQYDAACFQNTQNGH